LGSSNAAHAGGTVPPLHAGDRRIAMCGATSIAKLPAMAQHSRAFAHKAAKDSDQGSQVEQSGADGHLSNQEAAATEWERGTGRQPASARPASSGTAPAAESTGAGEESFSGSAESAAMRDGTTATAPGNPALDAEIEQAGWFSKWLHAEWDSDAVRAGSSAAHGDGGKNSGSVSTASTPEGGGNEQRAASRDASRHSGNGNRVERCGSPDKVDSLHATASALNRPASKAAVEESEGEEDFDLSEWMIKFSDEGLKPTIKAVWSRYFGAGEPDTALEDIKPRAPLRELRSWNHNHARLVAALKERAAKRVAGKGKTAMQQEAKKLQRQEQERNQQRRAAAQREAAASAAAAEREAAATAAAERDAAAAAAAAKQKASAAAAAAAQRDAISAKARKDRPEAMQAQAQEALAAPWTRKAHEESDAGTAVASAPFQDAVDAHLQTGAMTPTRPAEQQTASGDQRAAQAPEILEPLPPMRPLPSSNEAALAASFARQWNLGFPGVGRATAKTADDPRRRHTGGRVFVQARRQALQHGTQGRRLAPWSMSLGQTLEQKGINVDDYLFPDRRQDEDIRWTEFLCTSALQCIPKRHTQRGSRVHGADDKAAAVRAGYSLSWQIDDMKDAELAQGREYLGGEAAGDSRKHSSELQQFLRTASAEHLRILAREAEKAKDAAKREALPRPRGRVKHKRNQTSDANPRTPVSRRIISWTPATEVGRRRGDQTDAEGAQTITGGGPKSEVERRLLALGDHQSRIAELTKQFVREGTLDPDMLKGILLNNRQSLPLCMGLVGGFRKAGYYPSNFSLLMLMEASGLAGRADLAVLHFRVLMQRSTKIRSPTLLIESLCRAGQVCSPLRVLVMCQAARLPVGIKAHTMMVRALAVKPHLHRGNMHEIVQQTLRRLSRVDQMVVWNRVLDQFLDDGDAERAWTTLLNMHGGGWRADMSVTCRVMASLIEAKQWQQVQWVLDHTDLTKSKMSGKHIPRRVHQSLVIEAFTANQAPLAKRLLNWPYKLETSDIGFWHDLLKIHKSYGNVQGVLEVFQNVRSNNGMWINGTHISLGIEACINAKAYDRVEEMVAIGERAGIPRNDHFVMAARIRAAIVADHQSEVLELADEATADPEKELHPWLLGARISAYGYLGMEPQLRELWVAMDREGLLDSSDSDSASNCRQLVSALVTVGALEDAIKLFVIGHDRGFLAHFNRGVSDWPASVLDLHDLDGPGALVALVAWLRYMRHLGLHHRGANPWADTRPDRVYAFIITGKGRTSRGEGVSPVRQVTYDLLENGLGRTLQYSVNPYNPGRVDVRLTTLFNWLATGGCKYVWN